MSIRNNMHRTQVYLTEAEHRALKTLARRSGRSFSATLRDAIDAYIHRHRTRGLGEAIDASFGCWRDRGPEIDPGLLRAEWEARAARHK